VLYFIYVHYPISLLTCGEDRPSNHLWQKITATTSFKHVKISIDWDFEMLVSNLGYLLKFTSALLMPCFHL